MRRMNIIGKLVICSTLVAWAALSGHTLLAGAAAIPDGGGRSACRPPAVSLVSASVHRAALVVTFGNGTPTKTFCIEFTENTISGLQLLQRSGLPLVTSGGGLGAAVCAIDGVGSTDSSSYNACFGKFPDYWAYDQYASGAWHVSSLGASSSVVSDGSIEGWAWGASAKPDAPGTICPIVTPPPAATPTTIIPTPAPANTPAPLPSAAPSAAAGVPTAPPATPYSAVSSSQEVPPAIGTASAAVPPGETTTSIEDGQTAGGEAAPTVAAPAAGTANAGSETPGPMATPRTGAVIVGATEGALNESQGASTTVTRGGGSRTSLVAFAIVAGTMIMIAGVVYWRRRLG